VWILTVCYRHARPVTISVTQNRFGNIAALTTSCTFGFWNSDHFGDKTKIIQKYNDQKNRTCPQKNPSSATDALPITI